MQMPISLHIWGVPSFHSRVGGWNFNWFEGCLQTVPGTNLFCRHKSIKKALCVICFLCSCVVNYYEIKQGKKKNTCCNLGEKISFGVMHMQVLDYFAYNILAVLSPDSGLHFSFGNNPSCIGRISHQKVKRDPWRFFICADVLYPID